jgi:hypothetical protein
MPQAVGVGGIFLRAPDPQAVPVRNAKLSAFNRAREAPSSLSGRNRAG